MPFKRTASSLLKPIGHPGRRKLVVYADVDLLDAFMIQISEKELQPVCAIKIIDIISKCIQVNCSNSSYVVVFQTFYEHH